MNNICQVDAIFFSSQKWKLGYIIQNQFSHLKLGSMCHWKIGLEVHFCERFIEQWKQTLNYLICFYKWSWRERNPLPSVFRVTTVYSFLCVFSSTDTDIALEGVGLCTVASGQPVLAKEIVLSVVPGTPHEHLLQHSFRVLKDIQDIKEETTAVHRVLYRDTFLCLSHAAFLYNTVWKGTIRHSQGAGQLCKMPYT